MSGIALILMLFSSSVLSQHDNVEYKIKAAYLYNFTKFIDWPENQLENFNVCILGKDPFGLFIDPIETRSVNNKPIKIFRLDALSKARHCHIVYFGKSKEPWNIEGFALSGEQSTTQNKILLIGESKEFTQAGGMIAFVFKEGKIKLQINLDAVRQSHLIVSAQLLEVAEIIKGGSDD